MDTYVFKIKSARGVHLDYLFQELSMIIDECKTENESTKIERVPVFDCILLTTNNLKLRTTLIKDEDFILV
ncbi:MAG: hypothetical protein ABI448_03390 [Bacteroidia bacterium]